MTGPTLENRASSQTLSRSYVPLALVFVGLVWFGAFGELPDGQRPLLIGLALGALVPVMWLDTLALCGVRCLRAVPVMARLFPRCRRASTLVGFVVLLSLFLFSPRWKHPPPHRGAMVGALAATVALLWLQPPVVLFLGESAPASARVLAGLSSLVYPLRVVCLLDPKRMRRVGGAFSPFTDNIRTESEADWRRVVDQLAEVADLIVLDARTTSPMVVAEVRLLRSLPDRLARTTFIVDVDGRAPALAEGGFEANDGGVRTLTEDRLGRLRSSAGV